MMVEAQLRGIHSERQAEQLRKMEDWNADVFLENSRGVGLLAVEIEVTERAWRDEQIRALVLRFHDVVAAHGKRLFTIEREHRKAAAFRRAAVLDRFGAQERDELLQVGFALGALFEA